MIRVPDWLPYDVSRETLEKLHAYSALIHKWNPRINLVARSTLQDLEDRHIWDSAQVYIDRDGGWVDFGSGGGLPGVVVAILADGFGDDLSVTLVESDQRKAAFLRTCARELEIPMKVIASRVESIAALNAYTISARALAPLDMLLGFADHHLAADGLCVFQKGEQWRREIADAERNWRFSYEVMHSKTKSEAVVLQIKDIQRV
ncbi:16S rRNA (guanine(527)-N(7))-methyltransferase RsmG [Tateyamaria sp. ANG-S1]|uniref:16S rRNA (guanine(527)-N(7))-methyltransferase RsmG n=1 Tax=Tateyamaria sp. ANG-S1 TaxID=1577905 RepID=UPI00057EA818|nr:16S rRNA (guanine(527)-N(7))-methyltransferase RsmG [Tateyamaria sp. ANG-S1]KIC49792.1 16S rRNA methyltransferase [Tateyamaria sp. ANG-S1]